VQTKDNAKKLRRSQTPEELKLWNRLKNGRLAEYKFRRQVTIDNFIVDFCCFKERLIIELDGQPHRESKLNDKHRDEYLKSQGFTVIRFWDGQIQGDFEKILNIIISALESPSSGLRPPSPVKGEGKNEKYET